MSTEAELLRQRTASLCRAWEMLQIIRKIIEASEDEPLPPAKKKSFTEEGMIIAERLARHLARLHDDRAFCQQTVDMVWKFKEGSDMRVSTHSDRAKVGRMIVKTDSEIFKLARLAQELAEEIEKRTGETLYHRPTMREIERMLFPRRDGMSETFQRRRNA